MISVETTSVVRGESQTLHFIFTPRLSGVSEDLVILTSKYRDREDSEAGVNIYLQVAEAEELRDLLDIAIGKAREHAANQADMSVDEWERYDREHREALDRIWDDQTRGTPYA